MSKHTPEPWHTGREDMQSYDGNTGQPFSSVYATDDRGGIHLGKQLPLVIARVDGENIERDEEKANTRLIAAAPCLLAALKRLLDERNPFVTDVDSCECGENGDGHDEHGNVCEHIQATRAIVDAEGK